MAAILLGNAGLPITADICITGGGLPTILVTTFYPGKPDVTTSSLPLLSNGSSDKSLA